MNEVKVVYLECVRCPKLGKKIDKKEGMSCDGPNFMAAPPDELIFWIQERKKFLGITNVQLAEMSNMPKGTVDSLISGRQSDFKFGTIQPILKSLVGEWSGDPCPDPDGKLDSELRAQIDQLSNTVAQQEKRIADYIEEIALLRKHNEKTVDEIQKTAERQAETRTFLQTQIHFRNRIIAVMGTVILVLLAVVIGVAAAVVQF